MEKSVIGCGIFDSGGDGDLLQGFLWFVRLRFRGGAVRHLVMQAELEEVDEGELGLVSLPVDEMEDGERVWMSQAALLINQSIRLVRNFRQR